MSSAHLMLSGHRSLRIIYALVLTALSLWLINPYRFGLYDHWYMLPWLENLRQPELFAIDPVTAQRQYHYSILYKVLQYLPLPFYAGFFGIYTLCIFSVFYLSMSIHLIFDQRLVYLTPLLLLVPWGTPGATNTLPAVLLMRLSNLPFLFLAMYFWLRTKSFWAWLFLGVAFLLHPTTALYLAAFFGINLLLDPTRRLEKKEWLSILAFIVLSLPVFVQKLTATDTGFEGFLADGHWLETIRIRSAHHAFPDSWPKTHVLSGLCLFLLLATAGFAVQKWPLRRFLLSAVISVVVIYACGVLFTYVWPSYLGIQVQPFRVARIMMLLALLFFSVVWLRTEKKPWALLFHVALAGLLYYGAYQNSRFHFFYYFSLSLPLWFSYYLPKLRKYAPVFLLITAYVVMDNRSFTPLNIRNEVPAEREELYSWIRENTSQNSLWITPSDMMYFRNHSKRNVLVAWYDGTFGYFDHNYNTAWRHRYEKVFDELDMQKTEPNLRSWGELEQLTSSFGADEVFVLKTEPVQAASLKEEWQGGSFYIYRYTGG